MGRDVLFCSINGSAVSAMFDCLCCILLVAIMISITTVQQIHIQIQAQYNYRKTLLIRHERFINFWFRFFSTKRERHSSYYANHPQWTSHLVIFKISISRDLQNSSYMTQRSSSSCHVASTDIPDPLLPLLPVLHRPQQVFRATSRILT